MAHLVKIYDTCIGLHCPFKRTQFLKTGRLQPISSTVNSFKIGPLSLVGIPEIPDDLNIGQWTAEQEKATKTEFDKNYELLVQATETDGNAYDFMIQELQKIEYPKDYITERHHIVPRFVHKQTGALGLNDKSNIVRVSPFLHAFAHYVRWRVYNCFEDEAGFKLRFRVNTQEVARIQLELCRKGGKIGGKLNTPAQREARSKRAYAIGTSTSFTETRQQQGRIRGVAEQSAFANIVLQQRLIFLHKETGTLIETGPREAFVDIAKDCHKLVPASFIKNQKNLNKLVVPDSSYQGGQIRGSADGWVLLLIKDPRDCSFIEKDKYIVKHQQPNLKPEPAKINIVLARVLIKKIVEKGVEQTNELIFPDTGEITWRDVIDCYKPTAR